MLMRIIAILLILFSVTAHAGSCPYPKKPINWILRYCAMQAATDDEVVIQDSPCFKEAVNDANSTDPCKTNEKYKAKICDGIMKDPNKYRSKTECMNDTELTPYIPE